MHINKKITYYIYLLIVLCMGCKNVSDLSTPQKTIETYHRGLEMRDITLVNGCFYNKDYSSSALGKSWLSYNIVQVSGVNNDEGVKKRGDVEVIVKKKYLKTTVEFWYLLRKYNENWLIIHNSAMQSPDNSIEDFTPPSKEVLDKL